MSHKHHNDDEFFAQFDNMNDTTADGSDSSDEGDFFYGSGKDYRGGRRNVQNKNAEKEAYLAARAATRAEHREERAERRHEKSESAKRRAKKGIAMAEKGMARAQHYVGTSKKKPEDKGFKKVFKLAVLFGMVFVMTIGLYVGFIFFKTPAFGANDIYSMISQSSEMYDTEGKSVESLYLDGGNRSIIKYKDIPEDMAHAVIAIEDQKFETHNGFNFIRMIGAIRDSIFGGGRISGTSTISQQLARNVFMPEIKSTRSLNRKIAEMYCTIVLEKELTKDEIMEAYLNTVYLGFNSYGVETAADAYFSKDAKDLTLEECVALAAIPQLPDSYALVYADYGNYKPELPVIKKTNSVTYKYNGDNSVNRRNMIAENMCKLGYISEAEKNELLNCDVQGLIKIGDSADASASSYFTDYALETVIDDFVESGLSESEARNMVYTGGLKIYTTMDSNIQGIMEDEFEKSSNYSSVAYSRTNADGNLVSDKGKILAYAKSNYFNDKDQFLLKSGEYKKNSDGSMTILKGKRLNLYSIEVNGAPDVSVEFKGMYTRDNGVFYFIESGALSIPQGYKSTDANGNCVVSAQFFKDYPDFFKKSENGYLVNSENYSLKQRVRQPQAAAVLVENGTGEVKAMMGGRGVEGKQLYNRAIHPRQPGSSIKPLAIYGPALQMSFEYEAAGKTMLLDTSEGSDWGNYMTAGSIINDAQTKDGNGKVWPRNVYRGYKGNMTMRESVQQSVNVCSYKTYLQIEKNEGAEYSINKLKEVGITTLNEEVDANPAALALGGLTNGLTPLEEAAAFSTFPNAGVYQEPIFYTKVCDRHGDVLLSKESMGTKVYDEGVAWIMTDILRTVVTSGGGRNAAIGTQPVGGKTGTTTDQYDIWFTGFTPQYTMSLWMGNDINMDLSDSSPRAARFWSQIMRRACEGIPTASFFPRPANVEVVGGEYFTKGTYSKVTKKKSTESETTTETTEITTETTTIPSTAPTTRPTTPTTNNGGEPAYD